MMMMMMMFETKIIASERANERVCPFFILFIDIFVNTPKGKAAATIQTIKK